MTPEELSWLESRLGVQVPSGYRALVTAYPEHLSAYFGDYDLLDDPREIVIENVRARRRGGARGSAWRPTLLVIGADDRGRFVCLDLDLDPAPVLTYDPQAGVFSEKAPSFEAWWPRLLQEFEDAG